jgi:membrane associated rhomboid family serine protease
MRKPQSVVISLITIICGFYLYQLIDSGIVGTYALYRWDYFSQTHEYYRLFTVALLHDTSSTIPFHLAFNMMALHQLGTPLEYVFGKAKFLAIFFFSLLSGSLASSIFMDWSGYSIGASGAVFGLFGAFIAAEKYLGIEAKSIYIIVGINFALGFTIGGVDWRAHLGGLIGGWVITKLLLRLNASK